MIDNTRPLVFSEDKQQLDLHAEMMTLLQQIGPGHMMNTAYDTAWVARLHKLGEPMAIEALNWLREHQLADGSWGAEVPVYHHDRVICTLAAVIALAEYGLPEDRVRLDQAMSALDKHLTRLYLDQAGETIAFEMLFPTLISEAKRLGLIESGGTALLNDMASVRETKLANSPGGMISRFTTLAFSAEMAGSDETHLVDIDNLQENDGSVGYSPSATAYSVLNFYQDNLNARDYLRKINNKGGFPNVAPFDTFEQAWTLWNLALTEIQDSELDALCQPILDDLEQMWVPGKGAGFAAGYASKDSDGTSVVYGVLTHYGRSVDLEAVLSYEESDYFRCFALEANPSVSANIHVLHTLRQAGLPSDNPSIRKIIRFLQMQKRSKDFWLDKWHISPYYTTAHAIIANSGLDTLPVDDAIRWIIETQNENGSWGYYVATAEETAYCLQALVVSKRNGQHIPDQSLERGARWLHEHLDPPYPPLWIGKCLYSPFLVIRSAILSALLMVG